MPQCILSAVQFATRFLSQVPVSCDRVALCLSFRPKHFLLRSTIINIVFLLHFFTTLNPPPTSETVAPPFYGFEVGRKKLAGPGRAGLTPTRVGSKKYVAGPGRVGSANGPRRPGPTRLPPLIQTGTGTGKWGKRECFLTETGAGSI